MVSKTHNDNQWTRARFNSFIKGALRQASNRWPPKYQVKKEARVSRGKYRCAGYKKRSHIVPASLPPAEGKVRRINNVQVDHIVPIVNPEKGFTTWDEVVNNMFCEKDGLQVLCHSCHQKKTQEERKKKGKS